MKQTTKIERDNISPDMMAKLIPGTSVYTIVRHVSQSGMSRDIDTYIMGNDEPIKITYITKTLLGLRWGKNEGVRIGGCGMDMGFALVYDLSCALFPDGFNCVGTKCPSNDHSNGDRVRIPHNHRDGGYALTQRWM